MQVYPSKSNHNECFSFFQNGVGTFKCYQENHDFSASIKGEFRIIVWFRWETRSLFNAESSLTSSGQKWKCNRDKEVEFIVVLFFDTNKLCFVRSKLTECNARGLHTDKLLRKITEMSSYSLIISLYSTNILFTFPFLFLSCFSPFMFYAAFVSHVNVQEQVHLGRLGYLLANLSLNRFQLINYNYCFCLNNYLNIPDYKTVTVDSSNTNLKTRCLPLILSTGMLYLTWIIKQTNKQNKLSFSCTLNIQTQVT